MPEERVELAAGLRFKDGAPDGPEDGGRARRSSAMELEICVDSVESAVAAEMGGADRVELCCAIGHGGLTPGAGLIQSVRSRIGIGLHVMIRPRAGDFFYSEDEFETMRRDVLFAADSGADGVVLGLLTADSEVDGARTRELVELAGPMQVTFHRAIDLACGLDAALEMAIEAGAARVLTSGGAESALLGGETIRRLVETAGGRIRVMACGQVRPDNARQVAQATRAREFHAAISRRLPSPVRRPARPLPCLGDGGVGHEDRHLVAAEDVRRFRRALDEIR